MVGTPAWRANRVSLAMVGSESSRAMAGDCRVIVPEPPTNTDLNFANTRRNRQPTWQNPHYMLHSPSPGSLPGARGGPMNLCIATSRLQEVTA